MDLKYNLQLSNMLTTPHKTNLEWEEDLHNEKMMKGMCMSMCLVPFYNVFVLL